MNQYLNGLIQSSLTLFAKRVHSPNSIRIAKQFLPYAIFPRGNGAKPSHIILNREYKPIGYPCWTNWHFNYADPLFDVFSIDINTPDDKPLMLYCGPNYPWLSKALADDYKKKVNAAIQGDLNGK